MTRCHHSHFDLKFKYKDEKKKKEKAPKSSKEVNNTKMRAGKEVPTPHRLIAWVCKTSIENPSPLRMSFTKGLMQQSGNPKWTTNNTYPFCERKGYSPAPSSPVHAPKLNVFILLNVVFLFLSSFSFPFRLPLPPYFTFFYFEFYVCCIHLTPPVIGITKINTLSTHRLFDFVY